MLTEVRVRSKISAEAMEARVAKVLTPSDYDVKMTGPTKVFAPDGRPLCVYLPGTVRAELEATYPILTTIRATSENRADASGTREKYRQNTHLRSRAVMSSLMGSFESSGFYKFCRLTSWTADEMEDRWPRLLPLWQAIADRFVEYVPDRHAAQMARVRDTDPHWIIPGTPFTTITVNSTYATGVHQDKGDLDEGFSCLAVCRRGEFTGGHLTFPEYRLAVDMQDGDLILMDAHAWHGNTHLYCACEDGTKLVGAGGPCADCGAERISVVCYFRTSMAKCGSPDEEHEKALAWSERRNAGVQADGRVAEGLRQREAEQQAG